MKPCMCTETKDNHNLFSEILDKELKLPININQIITDSECVAINLDNIEMFDDSMPNVHELLSLFENEMGIYHLWADTGEYCLEHGEKQHKMKCVYTGKGFVTVRVKKHLKEKWNIVPSMTLYMSFYACENRIAIYLEQLFLDTFDFHFNKKENKGKLVLETTWPETLVTNGTKVYEIAELMAIKNPEMFTLD